jgi:hypothetical protein
VRRFQAKADAVVKFERDVLVATRLKFRGRVTPRKKYFFLPY